MILGIRSSLELHKASIEFEISMRMEILIISALSVLLRISADEQVDLPYGLRVQPVKDYLKTGDQSWRRPLLAYFSIPYARPPVGDLRFRPPVDVENSNNAVLWNQDFADMCLQSNTGNDHQSEDCLTLSIFKPQNSDGERKLPVLIWTPGGSFNMGSGGGAMVPGLVANSQDDFIGVTINYRLGALGSLPSSLSKKAGILNLGLADQLMAYKWVQKHISLFGGDPKQVTVRGAIEASCREHSADSHDPVLVADWRFVCWSPFGGSTPSTYMERPRNSAFQSSDHELRWSHCTDLGKLGVPSLRGTSKTVSSQDRMQSRRRRDCNIRLFTKQGRQSDQKSEVWLLLFFVQTQMIDVSTP